MSEPAESVVEDLRARCRAALGSWDERLDAVIERDPGYAETFVALAEAAAAGPLGAHAKTLVLLACDAAMTYRNRESLPARIQGALDAGVPPEGVLEVLELVSVLGIHALNVGLSIALAEYPDGERPESPPARQAPVRERFERLRGYWDAGWQPVLAHLPGFLDRYTDFSAASGRHGVLDAKTRELVLIAIDAASTHLYAPGIRIHVRNARAHGATFGEIVQVFQLISLLGVESCLLGVPLLDAEAARPPAH
ncbi:carboxymuconolactone decarboxylase family protein [Spongiactinospora sp. TRM90649]|uniref:carboxymuconolactone decarboxylase family protein n=1 Tax=Spongiactinospora sp. TRM90649 TaxID=3031114 RepID=UPI0023F6F42A|nr:carboxymuconolactone decarboxylase family protein [Spongiactinospora sp. TRM90649]MDF5756309.1 carboxymuconolactone decarboxylase family protein [Spongiactinospora sp. TRM90649]